MRRCSNSSSLWVILKRCLEPGRRPKLLEAPHPTGGGGEVRRALRRDLLVERLLLRHEHGALLPGDEAVRQLLRLSTTIVLGIVA